MRPAREPSQAIVPTSGAEISISEGGRTPRIDFSSAAEDSRCRFQALETAVGPACQNELCHLAQPSGLVLEDTLSVDVCGDTWPFDWSTVDVPGSPGFSRLFNRLEIDSAAHVPHLSLNETAVWDSSCLSPAKLQKVFCDMVSEDYSSPVEWFSMSSQENSTRPYPQYPWRNIENVHLGYSMSPLSTEVYFWPSPPLRTRPYKLVPRSQLLLGTDLVKQKKELEYQFVKLRDAANCSEDSEALLAVIENLADVLDDLKEYEETELVKRKLVALYRRKFGPNHIKVLDWSTRLADLLRRKGNFAEAEQLNDSIRSTVDGIVPPGDPVAIQVIMNDRRLAARLGRLEDSERFQREILQRTLSKYGPRNRRTIEALSELGIDISEQLKEGGDKLLHTAVQLSLEELDELDHIGYMAMKYLSWMLNSTGASEESYNLATKAVERLRPVLGKTQKRILDLEEERAWSMIGIGKLMESEALFRDILSRRVEAHQIAISNTYGGLGHVLSQMGRFEEAAGWLEKSFQSRVKIYEADHRVLVETCRQLSECYEFQFRFDDALRLYQQVISKIRELDREPNETIAELESETQHIQEVCLKIATYCTYSDSETISPSSHVTDEVTKYPPPWSVIEVQDEMGPDCEEADELETLMERQENEGGVDDWQTFLNLNFVLPQVTSLANSCTWL
jgi:tetratricopeptide (TPR) repeat protein